MTETHLILRDSFVFGGKEYEATIHADRDVDQNLQALFKQKIDEILAKHTSSKDLKLMTSEGLIFSDEGISSHTTAKTQDQWDEFALFVNTPQLASVSSQPKLAVNDLEMFKQLFVKKGRQARGLTVEYNRDEKLYLARNKKEFSFFFQVLRPLVSESEFIALCKEAS